MRESSSGDVYVTKVGCCSQSRCGSRCKKMKKKKTKKKKSSKS